MRLVRVIPPLLSEGVGVLLIVVNCPHLSRGFIGSLFFFQPQAAARLAFREQERVHYVGEN